MIWPNTVPTGNLGVYLGVVDCLVVGAHYAAHCLVGYLGAGAEGHPVGDCAPHS